MRATILVVLAAGCGADVGVGPAPKPPPLALTVDQPAYGAYVGDQAVVSGTVNDPGADVWIEGYRVNVGADGSFQVEVPVTGDLDETATRWLSSVIPASVAPRLRWSTTDASSAGCRPAPHTAR